MYLGCGNGCTYVYDVATQRETAVLRGHTDYVHCVKAFPQSRHQLATGSEDGSVRLWDARTLRSTAQFVPAAGNGPHFRSWIACLDVNESEDWLVCGGGQPLSLWHLRAGTRAGFFGPPGEGNAHPQHVCFQDNEVGGKSARVSTVGSVLACISYSVFLSMPVLVPTSDESLVGSGGQ